MPMKLQDILEEQKAIRASLLELEAKPEDELNDEDVSFQDTALARFDELDALAKPLAARMEKLKAVRSAALDGDNRETGSKFEAPEPIIHKEKLDPQNPEVLKAVRGALMRREDIRGLALDVVERSNRMDLSEEYAENVTRSLERETRFPSVKNGEYNLAQHILTTGTDEYISAFRAYMEDPVGNAQRTALSLTPANGGFLLPYILDPSIVLTNASSANPWRRISRHETTTSNAWQGVASAGVNAAWVAEGAPSSDNTPTLAQIQIVPKKAAAWVFGSYEALADTDFAQQLPTLLGDARDRLEEAAFATGSGATQPTGVLTGATTTIQTATTLVYAVGDVYATHSALPPRFRNSPKAAWVMNVAYIDKTRQFDTAGGASFWTNLGKGQPETLLGAPIYESTTMFGGTQAVASKLAVYGDFSQNIVVDRVGVSLLYEPIVKDQATAFPTGQGGWYMFWRTGQGQATVNAFQVLIGK